MSDILFTDICLAKRQLNSETGSRSSADFGAARGDLNMVQDRSNLAQAVINRLSTRKGELTRLGHPGYGSRLHELIGEPNTARTRALARLYIQECLAVEPRIKEILSINVKEPAPHDRDRDCLKVIISLLLIDGKGPMNFELAVDLGG